MKFFFGYGSQKVSLEKTLLRQLRFFFLQMSAWRLGFTLHFIHLTKSTIPLSLVYSSGLGRLLRFHFFGLSG